MCRARKVRRLATPRTQKSGDAAIKAAVSLLEDLKRADIDPGPRVLCVTAYATVGHSWDPTAKHGFCRSWAQETRICHSWDTVGHSGA